MTNSLFVDKKTKKSIFKNRSHSQLYSFISENVNRNLGENSFKLGDTTIGDRRPAQWSKNPLYQDLETVNFYSAEFYPEGRFDPVITRDYNIHKYFIQHGIQRALDKYDLEGLSREQFIYDYKTNQDIDNIVEEALEDVKKSFNDPNTDYKYLTPDKTNHIPQAHFDRVKDFAPREYQKKIINKISAYHKNNTGDNSISLLSAPTRAGKSFICACITKELTYQDDSSITLIVSGVSGVMTEWKETFESHKKFEDYPFYTIDDFKYDNNLINTVRSRGEKHTVVFLTLQDLAGSNKDTGVKNAHKFLMEEELSLVISDEAHLAALSDNSKVLSAVLREHNTDNISDLSDYSSNHNKKAAQILGALKPKYGIIYNTATPYNALFSDTFDFNDDNTAIVTKNDIKKEARKWLKENPDKPKWKSPYFAIPEEYSFVIPTSVPLNELFKLDSNKNYIHYDQVKELFLGMFGVESSKYAPNIFEDKVYNDARLGNGIIITFNEKVETDIIEDVLTDNISDEFEIINVSSARGNMFTKMSTPALKTYINNTNKKPLILTVERLMTGTTLKKIDTVVLARTIHNASTLTQYIGRSGTPYVKTVKGVDENGKEIIEKVCVKPNCSTIYFDAFQAVEIVKIQVNYELEHGDNDYNGSDWLNITDEYLNNTPIHILDEDVMGLHKMNAQDVLNVVLETTKKDGSIHSMINTNSINIRNILSDNDLLAMMNELDVFGNSSKSLKIDLFDGELTTTKDDSLCWVENCELEHIEGSIFCVNHYEEVNKNKKELEEKVSKDNSTQVSKKEFKDAQNKLKELRDKTVNLVALLMLYAILHEDKFVSVQQLLDSVNDPVNDRLVQHLGINKKLLQGLVNNRVFSIGVDFSLSEIESVFEKESDRPFDNLMVALRSIGEFSPNEIMTPVNVVDLILDKIDWDNVKNTDTFIDPGCKSAVFLVSVYEKLLSLGFKHEDVRDKLYCVPTSGLTYELVKKVYQDYDWDVNNILFMEDVSCLELNQSMVKWLGNDMSDSEKDKKLVGLFDEVLKELADKNKNDSVNDVDIDTKNDNTITHNDADNDNITHNDADNDNTTHTDITTDNKLFTYTVSNPPYQEVRNGNSSNNVVINIFHRFQEYADFYSKNTVMIYPFGRWYQRGGKSLNNFGKQQLNDPRLARIYYYPQAEHKIFDNANIQDGIGIVIKDNNNHDHFTINNIIVNHPGDNILPLDNDYLPLVNKIRQVMHKHDLTPLSLRRKSRALYGIESDFVYKNPDKVILLDSTPNPSLEEPVKLLTNDKPGLSGRNKWYWIDKKDIPKGHEWISKYQFIITSAQFVTGNKQIENGLIIDNNSIHGRSKVSLISLDTESEINNFKKYINTNFSKKLYRQSLGSGLSFMCNFIPDLGDYSDNNTLIDWSKPLDPQLYELFDLSQEEIDLIENS